LTSADEQPSSMSTSAPVVLSGVLPSVLHSMHQMTDAWFLVIILSAHLVFFMAHDV
jgi:hypothetical protein